MTRPVLCLGGAADNVSHCARLVIDQPYAPIGLPLQAGTEKGHSRRVAVDRLSGEIELLAERGKSADGA
jgi:hypothetical protein